MHIILHRTDDRKTERSLNQERSLEPLFLNKTIITAFSSALET